MTALLICGLSVLFAAGVLQFKYLGQNTVDRPGFDCILKVLDVINGGRASGTR